MEMLLEDYPSLPSASMPQHTPLNRCHIFKINGVKALSYKTSLKKIGDNPVLESQTSAWAQAFFSTFLMGFIGEKLMQFSVKSFNTKRMQPTQWPSVCCGKNGATMAWPLNATIHSLCRGHWACSHLVCPKFHSELGITNIGRHLQEQTKSCCKLCRWAWGAEVRIKFS